MLNSETSGTIIDDLKLGLAVGLIFKDSRTLQQATFAGPGNLATLAAAETLAVTDKAGLVIHDGSTGGSIRAFSAEHLPRMRGRFFDTVYTIEPETWADPDILESYKPRTIGLVVVHGGSLIGGGTLHCVTCNSGVGFANFADWFIGCMNPGCKDYVNTGEKAAAYPHGCGIDMRNNPVVVEVLVDMRNLRVDDDEILSTGYGYDPVCPYTGPAEPTDADLLPMGWAPGGYGGPCRQCGNMLTGDKYTRICRSCAVKEFHQRAATRPADRTSSRHSASRWRAPTHLAG